MAISMTRFTFFAVLICSFAVILGNKMASAQCAGDMQGLMQECARYVQKSGPMIQPSTGCCGVVKNVDLPCVCSHITTEVEGVISMEKAAFISQACGKPLARGAHCGSYVVQGN
ncbi:putative bifunctional inhibitor/plant lipid transfer protein/seed storage helical [Helianthus debilis subsp. tardiflorus]